MIVPIFNVRERYYSMLSELLTTRHLEQQYRKFLSEGSSINETIELTLDDNTLKLTITLSPRRLD